MILVLNTLPSFEAPLTWICKCIVDSFTMQKRSLAGCAAAGCATANRASTDGMASWRMRMFLELVAF